MVKYVVCELCGKISSTKDAHEYGINGIQLFVCPECNFIFEKTLDIIINALKHQPSVIEDSRTISEAKVPGVKTIEREDGQLCWDI